MKSIFDLYLKIINEAEEDYSDVALLRTKSGQFGPGGRKSTVFASTENIIPADKFASIMGNFWVAVKIPESERKCYLQYVPEEKTVYIHSVPYEDNAIICLANKNLKWFDKSKGKEINAPSVIKTSKWFEIYVISTSSTSKKGIDVKNAILESLEGSPKTIYGTFYCAGQPELKSLVGGPTTVSESMIVADCENLTSLNGMPTYVGKDFNCSRCNLTSLEGAENSKVLAKFECNYNDSLLVDFIPSTSKFVCNPENINGFKEKYDFGKSLVKSTEDDKWPANLIFLPYFGYSKKEVEKHLDNNNIDGKFKVNDIIGLKGSPTSEEEISKIKKDKAEIREKIREMLLSRPNYRLSPWWIFSQSNRAEYADYRGMRDSFTPLNAMSARYSREDGIYMFRVSSSWKRKDQGASDEDLTKGFDIIVETTSGSSSYSTPKYKVDIDFSTLDDYDDKKISDRGVDDPNQDKLIKKELKTAYQKSTSGPRI